MKNKRKMQKLNVNELSQKYGLTDEQIMFFLENYDIDFTLGDLYINDFEIDEEQYRNIIQLLGNGSSNDHCNRSSLQEIHIYGLFGVELDIQFFQIS